jgi:hypothetical protein
MSWILGESEVRLDCLTMSINIYNECSSCLLTVIPVWSYYWCLSIWQGDDDSNNWIVSRGDCLFSEVNQRISGQYIWWYTKLIEFLNRLIYVFKGGLIDCRWGYRKSWRIFIIVWYWIDEKEPMVHSEWSCRMLFWCDFLLILNNFEWR